MGDAQGFAVRITRLLSDASIKDEMGSRAAKKARRHYDFDDQVEAYLSWYEELLSDRTEAFLTESSYAFSNFG
jgi:glycosyltransferase involved in cell wall biosynthesis